MLTGQPTADPRFAIPDVLADARKRLADFMALLAASGAVLENARAETDSPSAHELHVVALLKRAARRGERLS